MTELKPCPFCGGEARLEHSTVNMIKMSSVVVCRECGATLKKVVVSVEYSSDQEAADAWNRRVSDEAD